MFLKKNPNWSYRYDQGDGIVPNGKGMKIVMNCSDKLVSLPLTPYFRKVKLFLKVFSMSEFKFQDKQPQLC